MRLVLKLTISILIAIALVCAFVYKNPSIVNSVAKGVLEYTLSNKHLLVKIEEVDLSRNLLVLKNISLSDKDSKIADIASVEMNYSLRTLIKKRKLLSDVRIKQFVMDTINFDGSGEILYSLSQKSVKNLQMNFVGGGSVMFTADYKTSFGQPKSLAMEGKIDALPLMLHKAFWSIAPDNEIVLFLKDYISKGYVSGYWAINLDQKFFNGGKVKPEEIDGKFELKDVALRYDVEYPVLQDLRANVEVKGTKLIFDITHGYSGKVALYDGKVNLDWGVDGYGEVIVTTKGKGPALDLIEFIPRETVESLKKSSIDLTKVSGNLELDFAMNIPLAPKTENTYDVKANISNMNLKIFDDNIALSAANLKGIFDGKTVSINGKGKVNGFDSDLSYLLNLEKQDNIENDLHVKLNFTPSAVPAHRSFSAIKGKSIVDINYKSRGEKGEFNVSSNLKDVEFFIEKLGIHKAQGRKANLEITSSGEDMMPSILNIKVTGDDNLQILGNAKILKGSQIINLSKIRHFDTSIKALLTLAPRSLKADVSGTSLDLSEANMMNFIEKDAQARDTELKVNISRVKMKKGITLNDFVMDMRCDKVKCYTGEMDSKIGVHSFAMRLSNQGDTEQWEINSTNAGDLFKALGMYDNMKNGTLMLIINTSRKEAQVGKPIPIVDGHFVLKRFTTTNTPILARMVSFISLSGMMSLITNNKEIKFSEMVGDFSYKDNIIKISNAAAEGAYFDFTMSGWIDAQRRHMRLKGNVTPSLYGISTIVRHIPVVGQIFGGGKSRKGLISPPYTIKVP